MNTGFSDQNFEHFIWNAYSGEFDPGSERTLAAGLKHASRTAAREACFLVASGERVSNT